MKDHNEMTVDECRDELARSAGWCVVNNCSCDLATHGPNSHWTKDTGDCYRHPIPATLDEASRLTEGWMPHSVVWLNGVKLWQASALSTKTWTDTTTTTGTTELEARFRLRVAVTRAMAKEAGKC